jgi:cell division septum initiation protein DivIVA
VDVEAQIAQMEQLLAEARPVPLSASVMINRKDFDDILAEIRAQLPEEIRQSRWVLKERDELLAQAARESESIIADAKDERDRLVSDTEVVRAARREAEHIVEEAREQARTLRLEAEDYVDSKLANFEIVLNKTLTAVEKGRDRLRGRMSSDELAQPPAEAAPPADADPAGQFYDHEAGA